MRRVTKGEVLPAPSRGRSRALAFAQTQRCRSAESRQPRDDRIPGERSSRRTSSWRCLWRRGNSIGPVTPSPVPDNRDCPHGVHSRRCSPGCLCPEAATSDKSVGVATVAAWGCSSEGATEVAPACRATRRYVVPRLRPRLWSCCDRAARRLIEPLEQWPSDRHRGTRPAVRASLIAARTDGKRPAGADRPQLGRLWCAASSSHSTRVGGPLTPPS